MIPPTDGDILYDQRDFYKGGTEIQKDIRREIGMLFQGSALFDSMTVEDNVMFPLTMREKMSSSEKKDRVNFCLDRVGLKNCNHLMPSEISGGMQKRVGIARAIVLNPKYLFCDEPNSGLDPQTAITIDELITEITKEYNMTTVVVTHDMNSVIGMGEYIMYLYKGLKLWEGTSNEILDVNVPELKAFLFSNKLVSAFKGEQ